MTDWSDFEEEAGASIVRMRCSMGALLDSLEDDVRDMVERTMSRREFTTAGIHRALKSRIGDDVPSSFTVARHRRGDCTCTRRDHEAE